MNYYIHPQAICESQSVGKGTRLWAFSHVLPGAVIGEDCNICDGVFIENDVVVGNSVTVKSGVQLWDGVSLGDGVFVGPNATFTNDLFPRSKAYLDSVLRTVVKPGASIGANATILPGVTIGAGAMIGAGSVVTRDVPDFAIVVGNPARISGYANTQQGQVQVGKGVETLIDEKAKKYLVKLKTASDLRGSLVAGEVFSEVPFAPKRFFLVHDVPSIEARGAHAHKECHQFLVCVSGSVQVIVDDGSSKFEFLLDNPEEGLYMPPLTWGTQYRYSQSAVLLVLASHEYDSNDYIRDYEEFCTTIKKLA